MQLAAPRPVEVRSLAGFACTSASATGQTAKFIGERIIGRRRIAWRASYRIGPPCLPASIARRLPGRAQSVPLSGPIGSVFCAVARARVMVRELPFACIHRLQTIPVLYSVYEFPRFTRPDLRFSSALSRLSCLAVGCRQWSCQSNLDGGGRGR